MKFTGSVAMAIGFVLKLREGKAFGWLKKTLATPTTEALLATPFVPLPHPHWPDFHFFDRVIPSKIEKLRRVEPPSAKDVALLEVQRRVSFYEPRKKRLVAVVVLRGVKSLPGSERPFASWAVAGVRYLVFAKDGSPNWFVYSLETIGTECVANDFNF